MTLLRPTAVEARLAVLALVRSSSAPDAAVADLVDRFWHPRRRLFRPCATGWWPRWSPRWHYWWQAHALDVLLAAGDLDRARALIAGVHRRNRGTLRNDYFDDMAWMGLALEHAERAGLAVRHLLDDLLAALRAGYDPRRGCLLWRRGDTYVNVAANAPTAILAARTGDLGLARALVRWLTATLVDPVTYTVHDGRDADGALNTDRWSYNYGTVAGALLAVGAVEPARRVARSALRAAGADGALPAEGPGDAGLFRGICATHLADVARVTGDEELRAAVAATAAAVGAEPAQDELSGALSHALVLQSAAGA